MFPTLLKIGEWRLYSYGALIALGGALSTWFWLSRWKEMGLRKREDVWMLVNAILISGFLGGKLLFLIEYDRTALGLASGFSVMGAFGSVVLGVYVFARAVKVPFRPVLEYVCLLAPFWHAFGRLGCFAAGCCFGRPTDAPWGVTFENHESMVPERYLGVPLHPTQLYEAAGDLLIFGALYRYALPRKKTAPAYFMSYAALRFATEYFRGDVVPGFMGLTAGQLLAIALFIGGLLCIRS